ncbi:MAG: DUF4301 family protein [Alistipes sp.]|nr:DUF4301 family protein [Alistipes sp.]MBQ1958253.1 DUF4301 family protein [Alistipes sp.]MBQ2416232.1 DUF4301 family protein [Alistipes sp.]MBQ5622564.1 DUF4301 family protein [Alistipes sp.]MBQ5914280.1 DUF4301 family protein [Alistipes sp.]
MFSREDLQQIESHGLTLSQVEQQIENFRQGFPYLKIVRAASAGDGVQVLSEEEVASAVERYEKLSEELRVVKFVPASGAATRMFKELFEYINEDKRTAGIDKLLDNIEKFAFWPELSEYVMPDSPDEEIVEEIVVGGLGYGSKPKGLVTFHAYEDGARKAVEEHLVEGAMYARCGDEVYIHFTVSEEHKSGFWDVLAHTQPIYEERYGVKYNISFSVQKPSTDTIAVNPDNTPFRTDDGKLLFRPAGHGALIENLNDIEADIIFVKNIDNVTTDARRGDTIKYKKALAGVLLELQDQAFEYLKVLEVGGGEIETIAEFVEKKLCVKLPENYNSQILKQVLDRPIRVCGVVRNQGEPGGGPFWVDQGGGIESLQIAESSQIAPEDMHLMKSATHFNPVDLVCGVMDSRERKFDLTKYTDPATGFISSKSSGGRELRAQELPGLWNGAMANWNTVLVEVPITTFSPVKVVQDLLRPEHQ